MEEGPKRQFSEATETLRKRARDCGQVAVGKHPHHAQWERHSGYRNRSIVFQLLRKSMSGNARACRALLRYKQFVSQNMKKKVDLTFVDSAYTQAVARMTKHDG